ncbi:MAG: tRNA pseudouridine(55) synthase TruB, partial [Lachnospiraceae bacterium]|nr:tRNA pseudouridine(55) synthase TruB [Lachnospiraceae bacterium]
MNSTKIINTDLNGVIILDKPKDFTSNDCLSVIKKSLHVKKIGHTGTLDENATGVLACLVGTATKCQEYLMKTGSKIYEAELIFGIKTDTEDFT